MARQFNALDAKRQMARVSKDDLHHSINTPSTLYDFMVRLDYFMPRLDSALCSTPFMLQLY